MFKLLPLILCALMVGCQTEDPPWTAEEVDLGVVMQPQEASNWCWAAVGQAIARWHGDVITQSEIVTHTFERHCDPATCNGQHNPRKLFDLIGVKEMAYTIEGTTWSWEDLWKHELERGHLMKLRLINSVSAHMVVIGGYNPNGFYLYDPASHVKGKRQIITYEALEAGEYSNLRLDEFTFIEDSGVI